MSPPLSPRPLLLSLPSTLPLAIIMYSITIKSVWDDFHASSLAQICFEGKGKGKGVGDGTGLGDRVEEVGLGRGAIGRGGGPVARVGFR